MVRSLYFDSLEDSDYYDKLDGVMNRKKIRLRIYEAGSDYVSPEERSAAALEAQTLIMLEQSDNSNE